ncbi:DUF1295 domain-containing protein [Chloroflexota bacterium]
MNELSFFNNLTIGWLLLAAVVFISLFFVAAPYGRHIRSGWGPAVSNRTGWIVMESTAPLVFAVCFVFGSTANTMTVLFLFGLWEMHYLHRAFIYPFSLRGSAKRMPIIVISFAIVFNAVNGYLNGRHIFMFSGGYTDQWLADPRFITGLILFISGFIINRRADQKLRDLRKPNEQGYSIPHGDLYRWISCPNYLGEIIIWIGWAIATWSLPGLAFAIWTAANLIPRARSNHAWYRDHFPDYPPNRKSLVPGLW